MADTFSELPEATRRRIASLPPERRRALERLLQREGGASGPTLRPRAGKQSAMAPLSYEQRGLWLTEQLDPGSAAYVVAAGRRLHGPLEVAALERALNKLVRRHESLRTTFVLVDGEPVQRIAPLLRLSVPVIVVHPGTWAERAEEAGRLLQQEAQRPFLLDQGPLVRAIVIRLDGTTHDLLITAHHAVADGRSMGLLLQELATLYAAYLAGRPSPLADLPLQYADYAQWQHELLQSERLKRLLAYWKERLAGVPPLELPTGRPRPVAAARQGMNHYFELPAALAESLRLVSQREGVTLYMTLLAAFLALLARYSGQPDMVVGTTVSKRSRPELDGVVGHFVNTLALRTDLSGDPSVRELLRRVRDTTLGAFAHQDLPFERVVEALQPARLSDRNPLFQVLFSLLSGLGTEASLAGLTTEPLDVETGSAKFDLYFELEETERGLRGRAEYRTDLFDATTIERLADHYQTLLEGMVADPERRLSALPLLGLVERRQVVAEWNATARPYALGVPPHRLVEAQVRRTPESVAVAAEDGTVLTYAELDDLAERLARRLRALGAGPDVLVGVYLERSVHLVVALLGILKSGAAYLPLDPSYPRDRLSYVLEDAKPAAILTKQALIEGLPASQARTLCLDADGDVPECAEILPAERADRERLAYVIYTSGSTGRPKGVEVRRGAVTNFLLGMAELLGMTAADRLLAVTSLSFDIAILELLLPLTLGARVELASAATAADGTRLRERLDRGDITVLQATPVTWQLLLAAGWKGDRRLLALCGGEALPVDLAQQLCERSARVWNLYGPTETTVWSTAHPVQPSSGTVPIGRPIANTACYVLDDCMQPVPVGIAGELYIGGAGLGRGYRGRPDLPPQHFFPYPFADRPGARLYRTGDRARWLPGGILEYLGRTDGQVKLHGYRIEPGEVEAALRAEPAVAQVAVARREDRPGDPRLVAYLVARVGAARPAVEGLRGRLARSLPPALVPATFVWLDVLPLTPNGKVDRKALPAPPSERPDLAAVYAAPRTDLERTIAAVWRDVLRLDRVGLHDNFFDLGGRSLLLVQVQRQLAKLLEPDVTVVDLFRHPTVGALASYLSDRGQPGDGLEQAQLRARRYREALDQRRAVASDRSGPNG